MNQINILIVDDEALVRDGLKSLLQKEPFVKSISVAWDKAEFMKVIKESQIDVILLDIRLRGESGLELLSYLTKSKHPAQVVALTGLDGVELIVNLLKQGVKGIVYKLDGYTEILRTIEAVIKGESYFPSNILKIIQQNAARWDEVPSVSLTMQEKELLKAITTGATTKEIGPRLKMTSATAETYRTRLMKKLGVVNTAAMLAYAYRNGIL
jgi:DNA-binding NarL/FixJ family response regulator